MFAYERKLHFQKIAEESGVDPSQLVKKFPTIADDDGFDNQITNGVLDDFDFLNQVNEANKDNDIRQAMANY